MRDKSGRDWERRAEVETLRGGCSGGAGGGVCWEVVVGLGVRGMCTGGDVETIG